MLKGEAAIWCRLGLIDKGGRCQTGFFRVGIEVNILERITRQLVDE